MEKYTRTYMDYFGYGIDDYIPCERCSKSASSIHHIKYRSKFGKKKKEELNDIVNIMALCFCCHQMAHEGMLTAEELTTIHDEKLGNVKKK